MQSPCLREVTGACFHVCCVGMSESPATRSKSTTTVAASRVDFALATTSSLYPDALFSNHESLPSLQNALFQFNKAYPMYAMTDGTDEIREREYRHLSESNHVCLDYIGLGLFSHSQTSSDAPSSSSSSGNLQLPFFDVCYKSASLKSQILYGREDSKLEASIKKRIMNFMNVSEDDYNMVFTANRTSAFKLLAESYPFQTNRRLITVYDYDSESVKSMAEYSQKRGAKAMSAEFSWPSMRIQSAKLRKMVVNKRKKKDRGLFVFPLQSRMTGTRYSYLWMSVAQANGWHVALDACALGAKDMDTLGLSLIRPDFLICSFFKVFGENPSGFGCLFVKKSSAQVLESSTMARSIGIVNLVPVRKSSDLFSDLPESPERSFSGPVSIPIVGTSAQVESEIVEVKSVVSDGASTSKTDTEMVIDCRGLDHADLLGLVKISHRARCLINWLVNALSTLQHPHSEEGHPLIKIYGPKVKFDRGPAVSFNVFDWKGEKVEPVLVQKLADRSNISLSYGFLHNLWFADKYEEDKEKVLETKKEDLETNGVAKSKRKEKGDIGISVVTASLGFLTNFEDVYRVWAFVAQFLNADFVEKERWRYMALNQNIVEV
ncbi:hypothetical protein ACHQM5_000915 [Ranunculus cassubicifolius]